MNIYGLPGFVHDLLWKQLQLLDKYTYPRIEKNQFTREISVEDHVMCRLNSRGNENNYFPGSYFNHSFIHQNQQKAQCSQALFWTLRIFHNLVWILVLRSILPQRKQLAGGVDTDVHLEKPWGRMGLLLHSGSAAGRRPFMLVHSWTASAEGRDWLKVMSLPTSATNAYSMQDLKTGSTCYNLGKFRRYLSSP